MDKPGPPSNKNRRVDVKNSGGPVNAAGGDITNIVHFFFPDGRSGGPSTSRDNHEAEDTSNTQGIGVCDILALL